MDGSNEYFHQEMLYPNGRLCMHLVPQECVCALPNLEAVNAPYPILSPRSVSAMHALLNLEAVNPPYPILSPRSVSAMHALPNLEAVNTPYPILPPRSVPAMHT